MQPWERQPNEPDDAWEVFVSYRDRGSARRIDGLFPGKSTMQQRRDWYQKWDWRARVSAYDAYVDEAKLEAKIKLMANKEIDANRDLLEKLQRFELLLSRELDKALLSAESSDMPMLSAAELIKLMEKYAMLRRLIAGQTTSNDGSSTDYSAWDVADLKALRALHDKYKLRG